MGLSVSVEEAQANLRELIHKMPSGEEIVITENQQPIAKLVAEEKAPRQPRKPGRCKGMITLTFEDDEHLKDFAEYMP